MNVKKSSETINKICCKIKKLQSAHYAIVIPSQASIDRIGENIADSLNNYENTKVCCITCHNNKELNIYDSQQMESKNRRNISVESYEITIEKLLCEYKHLIVIVDKIEELDTVEQCSLLAVSRGIREETEGDNSYQLIVKGAWNFKLFQKQFKKLNNSSSPPLDSTDIYNISYYDSNYIMSLLQQAGCILDNPTELNRFICKIITETTGGDRFICEHVINILKHKSIDDFEEVLQGLSNEHSIETNIKKRTENLSSEALNVLNALAHIQFVEVNKNDILAEELRLASITKTISKYGRKKIIGFLSPVIADVVCSNLGNNLSNATFREGNLMLTENFTNIAAFSLITRIENTLRNLVVLTLETDKRKWVDVVGEKVKLYEKRLSIKKVISEQKNSSDSHVELLSEASISFLTTGELKEIFCNNELYQEYFINYFNDKPKIDTLIQSFMKIRNAVTHNRFVSYTMVAELERIHKDLLKYIGQYGKQLVAEQTDE